MAHRRFQQAATTGSVARYLAELSVGVLLLAIALRAWFVQGLIVPVIVSGGSMAETLHGPHHLVLCDACHFPFACGVERPPLDGHAVCPNCGFRENDYRAAVAREGDHVVIDRRAFLWRSPRRWETVVYRCPGQANCYCVKRVVGLPGESIEIRHGDVYVDGAIARKSLAACRAMFLLVHDASYPSERPGPGVPVWESDAQPSRWLQANGRFVYTVEEAQERPLPIDWLSYRHAAKRPIRDDYSYNQGESRRLHEVSDVMLSLTIRAQGQGMLFLQASDGRERFQIRVEPAGGKISLWHNGGEVLGRQTSGPLLKGGTQVELALCDRQVLLAIGRELLLEYPYDPADAPRQPTSRPVAIGSDGLGLQITKLKVWRDVYYTDAGRGSKAWGVGQPYHVSENAYFVLGDNSPISADSRLPEHGTVSAKLLVGKPFGVR